MPTDDRSKRRGLVPRRPTKRKPKVRKYPPDAVRDVLAPWFMGRELEGEQRAFCPLCEDPETSHSPSASFNAERGEWNCLKTEDHGGQIYDLVQTLGLKPASEPSFVAQLPKLVKLLPPPVDDPETYQIDAYDRLRSGGPYEALLQYLLTERGLTMKTLDRFHVGTVDGKKISIPIRTGIAGKIRNVRFYLPNARLPKDKMRNLDGHGSPAMLAFTGELMGNNLPVVLAEGEWDAMLTAQVGAGKFVAVTGTGSASFDPPDLSALKGRAVFVAYDTDDTGRSGAARISEKLRKIGATVYVLDLTALGLPSTVTKGEDLTDFFMHRGGTAEKLLAEMERLREDSGAAHDDIDTAMESAFLELGESKRDYTPSLLSEDDILSRPPIHYVIEPFLPRGMASVIFGLPGSGKTFVGQDMGGSVRAGMEWHGHAVAQGAVLLFEAEGLEQLQTRIVAWNEHHGSPELAAFRALDEPLDLSSPAGCAAAVRTVLGMEAATGEKVELVWIDPAALYMSTSENDDGNRNLIIGLNAIAKYLNIAVLLIVHTNAAGERARGTDHFKMLAGSYMRVEKLDDDRVGVVQEKIKNAPPHAVILAPVLVGPSMVLASDERMSAAEYAARKSTNAWTAKTAVKLSESKAANSVKNDRATEWILDQVRERPGISKTQLLEALMGRGVGSPALNASREALVEAGRIITSDGPRNALVHHLSPAEMATE